MLLRWFVTKCGMSFSVDWQYTGRLNVFVRMYRVIAVYRKFTNELKYFGRIQYGKAAGRLPQSVCWALKVGRFQLKHLGWGWRADGGRIVEKRQILWYVCRISFIHKRQHANMCRGCILSAMELVTNRYKGTWGEVSPGLSNTISAEPAAHLHLEFSLFTPHTRRHCYICTEFEKTCKKI